MYVGRLDEGVDVVSDNTFIIALLFVEHYKTSIDASNIDRKEDLMFFSEIVKYLLFLS